ncbi:MAG: hypothetical protein KKE62_01990 [Proteobacteria bacterium]|nr:hypothetical protein [Pseudomonadota bacterium]MBU1387090.1 hypothetical protein [Pseudomonadota bacterium]MBU1541593.1 hypothetical protein [Pseudomonadota bacterium]MBU2482550.1 hypothetical protein [Pseudomonadota bacterium]
MSDLSALRAGLCTEKEYEKCKAECGDGPELDWACENCPTKRYESLGPYTIKLLENRNLRVAGYPFEANDFTYEEWRDLGRLEQCLKTPAL